LFATAQTIEQSYCSVGSRLRWLGRLGKPFRLDSGRQADAGQVAAVVVSRGRTSWRRKVAWLAPVAVAGAVVATAALASAAPSSSSPALPARSPVQLLSAMQAAGATALSGQISETANLGLPTLPGGQASASLTWQTFVTGTHAARVWVDGTARQRFALIGELSEADVVHNGRDVWTYTSDTNTATHTVLGSSVDARAATSHEPPLTPAAASSQLLKAIGPTTSVRVGASRTVAGRHAYTLVVAPRDSASTIRRITFAVDSTRYVPLQVQVFGSGSSPAFQIGFTAISYSRPPASTFRFGVPKGAIVSTNPLVDPRHERGARQRSAQPPRSAAAANRTGPSTRVIGSGWTAVLELRHGLDAVSGAAPELLGRASTSVGSSGARLLRTALVNAVITHDGRAFIGAVQPALLEHIAASAN
jgi:outer membrane lipoprotein-sorting protein